MPKLSADQCYRQIKPVAIWPALAVLPHLPFVAVNVGSTDPQKSPCYAVPPGTPLPPEITGLVAGLGLGGETKRILLRKLAPGQGMAPHVDTWMAEETDWRRFHVPVVTDLRVIMRWPDDGQEVHLAAGWLWEVRYDRLHEVVNGWDGERVHIQIDQTNATI